LPKGIDILLRPACFGDFYYRDAECKQCDYRNRRKVEKMERSTESIKKNREAPHYCLAARYAGFFAT
jgi:hypothetical protein